MYKSYCQVSMEEESESEREMLTGKRPDPQPAGAGRGSLCEEEQERYFKRKLWDAFRKS